MVAVAGVEGGVRAFRRVAPGAWASRAASWVLIVIAMTSAGGLGLLVSGKRPAETLHLLYGALAFAAIPIADSLTKSWTPRSKGVATMLSSILAVVLVARLIATG